MICYINRSTVDYDIRLNKYVQACKRTNTPYFVIGWDRLLNAKFKDEHEYHLKVLCPYSQGKKIIPLLKWLIFVWYHLIVNFKKYKVIHACNMENTLIALPFKLLGKKIIFDVYDSQKVRVERKLCKMVDALILPSEKRLSQIGIQKSDVRSFLEVENVPTINGECEPQERTLGDTIHLSYVGTFQKRIRGIENLIALVLSDSRFVLDIAGTGDQLDTFIQDAANKCDRIKYHGKVLYSDALDLMSNSDMIVALYYLCAPTHKFASPNKYHESLFLGRPIITSANTLVGDRVKDNNTGYLVNDTLESLKAVFDDYMTDEFRASYSEKSKNCKRIWDDEYSNYREKIMQGEYINLLKQMSGI